MKKVLLAGFLVAALFGSGFSVVFAQTATSTSLSAAAALVAQIQVLQAQLESLKAAQQKVNDIAQGIQGTVSLIKELRQGMTSDDVAALQALLAADPTIYPEGIINGHFGPLTAKAVRKFQKKHGIEQVGNVGPKTLKKLNELLREHPMALEHESNTEGDEGDNEHHDNKGHGEGKRPCAIVPPGHLIAPGWLKKHADDDKPIVPPCQTLPPGIAKKLHNDNGTSTATSTPPTADTTAPALTGVASGSIASTTATISWTTNENATGNVLYSTTNPVPTNGTASSAGNTVLTMSHSILLSGLTASSTYFYVVSSSDASGNTATSGQNSFVTLGL